MNKIFGLLYAVLLAAQPLCAGKAVFVNRYMHSGTPLTEEVILTDESYSKRERRIHQKGNIYYVKPDTLLTVYPESHLGDKARVKMKNKLFLSPFYIFIRDKDQRLEIVSQADTVFLEIILDTSPPEIKLLPPSVSPAAGKILFIPGKQLSAWFIDLKSGLKNAHYRLDGKEWQLYSGPLYPSAKNSVLELKAEDLLGQISTRTFSLAEDTAWPETQLILPGEKDAAYLKKDKDISFFKESLSVEILARDNFTARPRIFYSLDNNNWLSYNAALRILTNCILSFYAADELGNTAPVKTFYFRKTKKKPAVLPH